MFGYLAFELWELVTPASVRLWSPRLMPEPLAQGGKGGWVGSGGNNTDLKDSLKPRSALATSALG